MSSKDNLYEILGISKDASESEIKKAYRKLAIKHHPDKGGNEEVFKKISHAYGILSDNDKRKQYDMFGTYDDSMPTNMPNFNDIFENIFQGGGMGDIFGGIFGSQRQQVKKGKDKSITLKVSLEEVFLGKIIKYRLVRKIWREGDKCCECDGNGQKIQMVQLGPGMVTQSISQCSKCSGNGFKYDEKFAKTEEEIIDIPLPKGIPSGHRLAIRGKGDQYGSLPNGDIIVTIEHKPHSSFQSSKRNPIDIIYEHNLTLYEVINGFQFSFHYIDGKDIIVESKNGIRRIDRPLCYRIPKKGFLYKNVQGDIVIHFKIVIPKSVEEIKLQKLELKESKDGIKYYLENLQQEDILL